jgi:hypothetical protein
VSWQQFKSTGQPIYEMNDVGPNFLLTRISRVIRHASSIELGTKRCVRFANRWQPLHEPEELRVRYPGPDGKPKPVLLNWEPFTKTSLRLPFIRRWDLPGNFYQVFGY